jgi:hypothetical protein
LIAFWIDEDRIGTRLQIMRNSVERRLAERDQQRAEAQPLSDDRVREGVMLIAAAATLAQSQIIRVPDGADNTKGIPPKSILPGWTDNEISALLSRPIFDNAIYGTVRFHHRSVREYLTAVWLAKLLEKPASRRAIESLLFRTQYGLNVIVPTMRPILPWLAIFDDKIRERIRKVAPEVIFEGGDPSALPLPTRQKILAEVCEKIADGTIVHSATEYAAVQRFAQPDIAQDIRVLLKRYTSNDGIAGFLMRMIWLGRLSTLLTEAKQTALASSSSIYTRIASFRALREIGSYPDQEEVRHAFLKESRSLRREWIGELITDLVPSKDSIDWVLHAIGKSEDKEPHSIDRMSDAVTSFTEATRLEELPRLLAGMGKLLDQTPVIERGYCEVSQRFSWLMKTAAHAVERLIRARVQQALHPDSLEVLHKFRAIREWGDDLRDFKVGFGNLMPEWRELNDASFWHDVAATRTVVSRKKGERLTDYWQAQVFGAFWKFAAADFERVCNWVRGRPEQDDRLVALTLAFAIYSENGRPRAWRELLNSAVAGNAELESRLLQLFNPPPQNAQYRRQEQRWKRQAAARAKKESEQLERDKQYALINVELIRDPNFANPADLSRLQWYLHHKIREKNGGSSKWTDGRWRELIPMFGEEVAKAYRDGAMAYWKRYKPVLRSEGAAPNTTAASVIFGLTGLAIESREKPNWMEGLSLTEAELAARYGLNELNGFPSWFPAFYAVYRDIAAKVILTEIEYELSTGQADQDINYVLSDIGWSAEWAWNDLAPSLYSILQKDEPKNGSQLHQLLKIIQGSSINDSDIAGLASGKIRNGVDPAHVADWFAVWTGADPDAAIPALGKYCLALKDDAERTAFAMRFVTKLWGGRRSETFGARGRFQTPSHLRALYSLMHQLIRVQDDIDRAGRGVYSPGLRDDAQDGRNRILKELNEISGKEAFLALEAIAVTYRRAPSYPYLEMLCRGKAEQEADLKPWTPINVREFHDRLDRTPSTHRELADLAILRLLDLKDDLEEGDASVAAIIKAVNEETMLRNFIGHELRQKAFGRYAIPQEEEMADAKRPDLRFHGVCVDAPVPVELKIADNWSGPSLFERLENQLAGDYLRDVRSGRGVFALVYRGEKMRWELPGSLRSVYFDGLIDALREHWAKIAMKFPGVDDISVIGIDLTKRGN